MEYLDFLNSNNVSNFEEVKELLNTHNIRVKEDGDLYLVYYKRENKDDSLNMLQLECNGMILEKDTNNIVCNSYNKFCKYRNDLLDQFKLSFNNLYIEPCYEGTLIRVYYYGDSFRVATKKCIDAKDSKWNSDKSYNELFREAVQNTEYNGFQFEKNKVYFFLLKHPENTRVFNYNSPDLVLLDIFRVDGNSVLNVTERVNKNDISSYQELVNYINHQTIDSMKYQGFIIFDSDNPTIKQRINFPLYNKISELYGNESSRYLRFLELREDMNKLKEYIQYFPEHKKLFLDYENAFIKFATDIHGLYMEVKVFKKEPIIQKNFRKLIYNLHGIYLKDRVPISVTSIINHLVTLDKKLVKFLYENYKDDGLYQENDIL
jgi:hypothetical protein